ncbi:murein L,D-transpeptidase [Rhodovarius crocodyli]|uniref:Murein L,D-transpeptidase n=1 Tax=Rhodovarius crocodyli TaxID=1979269 RepID=A0A437MJA4_9PROT|nr:L,D-transpeptidase family protein [Rhodovarius crocodyli]RVT97730.1 murein L,D-transpeptidase [Rhodovarius crocodyli]
MKAPQTDSSAPTGGALGRRHALLAAAGMTLLPGIAMAADMDAVERLAQRLRGLEADGLDPAWYQIPPREAAYADPAGYAAGVQNAARLALQDLVQGRAAIPTGRIDIRRDPAANPIGPWLTELSTATEPVTVIERAAMLPEGAAPLKAKLAEARARLAGWTFPQIPVSGTIEPGRTDSRVPAMRERLSGTDPVLAASPLPADPNLYDETLQAAVRRFQQGANLEVDGRVGPGTQAAMNRTPENDITSLRVALDMRRGAWKPGHERRVDVNLPDFTLAVKEGDRLVLGMDVVVGRPGRATPLLATRLTTVQFNPPWGVPVRNAVEDKLPQLQRNPLALQRAGIRIFQRVDGETTEVDPTTINWRSYSRTNFPFIMRQDPGELNALGRLKFIMPNGEDIYMHDTSEPHLFRRPERAYSSGCIRLSRPMDFLVMLMEGMDGWNRPRMERSVAEGRTFSVPLRRQLPVRLLYQTAVVENGGVRIRPDIYGLDTQYLRAMERGPARPIASRS